MNSFSCLFLLLLTSDSCVCLFCVQVAPVLLLLPPLLCVLLLVAAPSSALPPPPSCCSLLCSAYVLRGVVHATGFGALGSKVAEHWYELYKMDKQGGNLRFIYWWEDKVSAVLLSSGSE
ncbi:hypothetical protein ACQJBY_066641 [Aegilops geniculata]